MSTTNSSVLSPSTQAQRPGQSPLRFLFALMARLRTVDGPSLETDLALEALEEEQQGLATCAGAAAKVETSIERFTRHLQEFWADGILTAKEKMVLARDLLCLKRSARSTARSIETLR